MASWIGQSLRRGILTTHYPTQDATTAEVPATARPPAPRDGPGGLAVGIDTCPVRAITQDGVDQGKCIRCARCVPQGFAFSGPVESSALNADALVTSGPSVGTRTQLEAPLREFGRSLHLFMIDVGSCNACNLEVLALSSPFYDSQRLGIFFTNSPRHADVLLVVGTPTVEMLEPLRRAYDALPEPKRVVAVGACPISGGAFAGTSGLVGPLAAVLRVDLFIPGCPPTPVQVLDGLLMLTGRARRTDGF